MLIFMNNYVIHLHALSRGSTDSLAVPAMARPHLAKYSVCGLTALLVCITYAYTYMYMRYASLHMQ